jgi:hypothetical protein
VIAEVQMKVARVKHNHDSSTRKMDYQKLHDQDTKDHKIKDQESLDVAEFMGINRRVEKAKTDDQSGEYRG